MTDLAAEIVKLALEAWMAHRALLVFGGLVLAMVSEARQTVDLAHRLAALAGEVQHLRASLAESDIALDVYHDALCDIAETSSSAACRAIAREAAGLPYSSWIERQAA
jgi:hypothetical protein